MTSSFGILLFVCGALFSSTTSTNNIQFETPLMYIYNIFTENAALVKHTIRSVSVSNPLECFRHCAKMCCCVAFQLTGTSCELLDKDKDDAAADLVTRQGTLLYTMQQSGIKVNTSCLNGCCKSQPCLNGGQCVEKCNDIKEQYTCACPENIQGRRCEMFYPDPEVESCQAIKVIKRGSHSGVYNLVISDNKTAKTYCDFSSETGKAWTLIESFSLANKEFYKNKPFYHDFPRNENNFTWHDFRVSYEALVNIQDNSTHWRVTCDFPSGLRYTDYARASLKDTDLLTFVNQDNCQRYEFVSVRGINCTDCTGMLVQKDNEHMHTDSYWSGRNGCEWDPRKDSKNGEDNFGLYADTNPQHKCTENSLSTTQWWLGSDL